MQELDRILDGHDVRGARLVDVVDHSRERRALAAARRPGDEHEAARLVGDRLQRRRQPQLVNRPNVLGDDAQDHADRSALLEHVAPEAPEPRHAVREVDFLRVLELLTLSGRHDRGGHGDDIFMVQRFGVGGGNQRAADSQRRDVARFEVQVRGAALDGDLQQVIDVHILGRILAHLRIPASAVQNEHSGDRW